MSQQTIVLGNAHLVDGGLASAAVSHVCDGGFCTMVAPCELARRHVALQQIGAAPQHAPAATQQKELF